MTPTQILEEVKTRFMVLYHHDPNTLERLLRQALGKFQDKAGVILEVWFEEPIFELPPHFRAIAGCSDSKRRYIAHRFERDDDGKRYLRLLPRSKHVAPFCLSYFCSLRDWELKEELPTDCEALVADYLEALIAILNTKKEREAYLQSGMQDAAQTLLTEQELRQRVTDLEKEMEDNKAIIPPASMF